MASGSLSGPELAAARAELDRVNQQHGFKRHEREDGGSVPLAPAEAPSPAEAKPEAPADPGPPRFVGIDLQNSMAIMSGNAGIPISAEAAAGIVDILLGELRAHMSRTLGLVSSTHGRQPDPAQIEIEFPDGRAD